MSSKPVIAVVGATGAQGGGLSRAILDDREARFALRVVTRDPDAPAAREFARRGAELARADLDDEASLVRALDGAHGAFLVTFFWAHFSPQREYEEAGNMARAAKAARIRHAVWSTLEDTRRLVPLEDARMPTLMESFKVPHFDAKGAADQLFSAAGVPTTFLLTSFYWENFATSLAPRRGPDGRLAVTLPIGEAKLPGIAAEDIGRCAFGIFNAGAGWCGRTVGIAGEHLTGPAMAAALSTALGEPVAFNSVTPDQFRAFGFPGAADLGNMFQYKRDFNEAFCAARSVSASRALNPDLQDFAAWLRAHASEVRRAAG